MKQAFTLIELLVVVLIIGILSAIALPQYQRAVEKAHTAEALQNLSALQRVVDIYLLENGYPNSRKVLIGNNATNTAAIDITAGMDCSVRGGDECSNRYFSYAAICTDTACSVHACRLTSGAHECLDSDYEFELRRNKSTNVWDKTCYYMEDRKKEYICAGLEGLGYTRTSCC